MSHLDRSEKAMLRVVIERAEDITGIMAAVAHGAGTDDLTLSKPTSAMLRATAWRIAHRRGYPAVEIASACGVPERSVIDAICAAVVAENPAQSIIRATADEYGVSVAEIKGPSRKQMVVEVRQEVMARLRAQGYSLTRIGQMLGRDHTTVLHGARMARAGGVM